MRRACIRRRLFMLARRLGRLRMLVPTLLSMRMWRLATTRCCCRIGNNVLLQNGVVIGADGFGFAKTAEGRWHKIPQPAPVVIEDDVEVQANSCIDRASVGETRIGRGSKVDNLVQVGHGSRVGEDALLCAQVGLAGSTEIGK